MAVKNDNVLNLRQKRREKVCQNMHIETPNNSYADILQRLVRRYLFKLERQKEEGKRYAGGIHTPRGYGDRVGDIRFMPVTHLREIGTKNCV